MPFPQIFSTVSACCNICHLQLCEVMWLFTECEDHLRLKPLIEVMTESALQLGKLFASTGRLVNILEPPTRQGCNKSSLVFRPLAEGIDFSHFINSVLLKEKHLTYMYFSGTVAIGRQ